MSMSLVSTKAFALKLKIHCNGCEKKLKQMLMKVQGVHSVRVDAKQGHVLITGTIDPPTILSMLEKLGKKAEVLWEQGPPVGPSPTDRGKEVEIVTRSTKGITPTVNNYEDIMGSLEELSKVPGLENVEVINTIKFSFKNGSVAEVTSTRNDVKRCQPHLVGQSKTHFPNEFFPKLSNSDSGHILVNGIPYSPVSVNAAPHGCCGQNNCCHWQSPRVAFGCNACPPGPAPPPWEFGVPSAPPVPYDYDEALGRGEPPLPPQPAPVRANNTFPSVFSDENPNSCLIM